jgi:hypothetical protein
MSLLDGNLYCEITVLVKAESKAESHRSTLSHRMEES